MIVGDDDEGEGEISLLFLFLDSEERVDAAYDAMTTGDDEIFLFSFPSSL